MNFHKDYKLVAIIGFVVGFLVLPPIRNFGFKLSLVKSAGVILFFTVFALSAMFILKRMGRRWPIFEQVARYSATGTLNTLIDVAILNLLVLTTGLYTGIYFVLFKGIGFAIGSVNSYFWNKFWTFRGDLVPTTAKEVSRFVGFTFVGSAMNIAVAYYITNVMQHPSFIAIGVWLNIAAFVAILVNMIWNFITYRRFVFRGNEEADVAELVPDTVPDLEID